MSSLPTYLLILFVVFLGLAGYYYLDNVVPMGDALAIQEKLNRELKFEIERLEEKNAQLTRPIEQKVRDLSDEKDEEIAHLRETYEALVSGLNEEIEKGEVTITHMANQLKVNIMDSVIFPSGGAELSPEGALVLRQVGEIAKNAGDRHIKVEGHTDSIPIHANLQDKFASNWELSVARATNVVRFLEEEVGIDARKLQVAGFGEHRPIASNSTSRGQRRNRRIEILLLPGSDSLRTVTEK